MIFKGFVGVVRESAQKAVRSQQIAWVCSTYGIAGGLASVGIAAGKQGLNWVGVTQGKPESFDAAFGRNLARTFVKLGPTFIKLGQVLATRPDLVGEPVAEELRVLFDRVPPVPFRRIRRILHEELGRQKVRHRFRSIEEEPLASASISQTHRAVLSDGTPVILKVQKPGVGHLVEVDLKVLESLVIPLDRVYPKWQLRRMFEDFRDAALREIDYLKEAQNIDKFQRNYRSVLSAAEVVFPTYHRDLTTRRVLALEPMRGKKVADLKQGSAAAKKAALRSLEAVLEQIFDHGFFHADPHSGNLFFLEEGGQVGFIDLGMVGQLQPEDKQKFLKVVLAVLKRDRNRLARSLFALGTPGKGSDYNAFEKEIDALLDRARDKGVRNLRLDEMIGELMAIARRNQLHIPNRYVLMMRSCLVIEGVARGLDPELSLFAVATPIVARSLMNSYNPIRLIKRIF